MPTEADQPAFPEPPRAGRDRVTSARDVVALARLAITLPLRAELMVLLLDGHRVGHTISVFDRGEAMLLDVLGVLERSAPRSPARAVVLVSVRPGGGPEAIDGQRWHEADALLSAIGLELVDWLVVGRRGVTSIPDQLGPGSRW